jgi:hypothetical protein
MRSPFAVASPARTTSTIRSSLKPCASKSASVQPSALLGQQREQAAAIGGQRLAATRGPPGQNYL